MSLIIAVLILAVLMIAGVAVVAYFAYKTVKVQQEMILNIAMFKKASDPFHLGMMRAAMDATEKTEAEDVQSDPNDDPAIPAFLSEEARDAIRAKM